MCLCVHIVLCVHVWTCVAGFLYARCLCLHKQLVDVVGESSVFY